MIDLWTKLVGVFQNKKKLFLKSLICLFIIYNDGDSNFCTMAFLYIEVAMFEVMFA